MLEGALRFKKFVANGCFYVIVVSMTIKILNFLSVDDISGTGRMARSEMSYDFLLLYSASSSIDRRCTAGEKNNASHSAPMFRYRS